ncbi:hypothetical protein [Limnoglobus roseus]|uniref:Glycine zipper domain-containing protein n=1 Tax=Limnoglobus roseus TaxID=2598579 RepID=A0A5C1ARV3_9BACT|nr:hypothetical protein [Limnoglobus roseus]QEL20442.1 hypothetical protein PX52LOC_07540 [Limnoglobus roseus]
MNDPRHNPDLDEAFGVSQPPATPAAPAAEKSQSRDELTDPKLAAALDRLTATVERINTGRNGESSENDTQGIKGETVERWGRVGELIGAASARIISEALSRIQTAQTGEVKGSQAGPQTSAVSKPGRMARAADAFRKTRVGRWAMGKATRWANNSRVGKAAGGTIRSFLTKTGVGRKAGEWATTQATRYGGKAAGEVVGQFVGRAAGTAAGAEAGAAVGSVVPGLGTLIGAVVGAALSKAMSGGPAEGGKPGGAPVRSPGGFAGNATDLLMSAAEKLGKFKEETEESSRKLTEMNRSFAQFSGLMARVSAIQDASEGIRSREKGDRLAASAEFLMESQQKKKDSEKESEIFWGRMDNYVAGLKNDLIAYINVPLNKMYLLLNRAVEGQETGKINNIGEAGRKLVEEIEKEEAEAQKRRDELEKGGKK